MSCATEAFKVGEVDIMSADKARLVKKRNELKNVTTQKESAARYDELGTQTKDLVRKMNSSMVQPRWETKFSQSALVSRFRHCVSSGATEI